MRITRQQMFMDMAEVSAKRSTCYRGNTGALVVKDNDILSQGYNGPPSGEPHCKGNACELRPDGGCLRSIHAEHNAIKRALSKTQNARLTHCDLYSMSGPCPACASLAIDAIIWRVFYRFPYRDPSGVKMLLDAHTKVYRVTPSGLLIEEQTGHIVEGELDATRT